MFASNEQTACAIREIAIDRDVIEMAGAQRCAPYPWFLDGASRCKLGRFSFFGADPYLVVRARDSALEIQWLRAVRAGSSAGRTLLSGDPLTIARAMLPAPPRDDPPFELPFIGGAVGYLGYELAAWFDRHSLRAADDLGLPDLLLLYVDSLFAYDAVEERLYACGLGFDEDPQRARRNAESACETAIERARRDRVEAVDAPSQACGLRTPEIASGSYLAAIAEAKRQIAAGEVYQTCLTRRYDREFAGDPWALYQRLRRINPAPFASYFEFPEVTVVSSSPERFVRLDAQGTVESRPIKGTRARGCTQPADRALREELAASPKDRAENLMIVDLVRNDLGRVCEIGSIDVPELMAIESHASVHQMVSTVRGQLRADRDAFDLVRATFPPGSMTGAPKIAAMRILDRLEPVRRGIYSGAIGYFDVRKRADLCVVIRTILLQSGRAYLYTGGGIVADSDAQEEWAETLAKARPLEQALGI